VTQKTLTPPGELHRLSVAVLLNGRWEQRGPKSVFVPRSADEVKVLEEVVKRAVGFNVERGDSVLVQAAQFSRVEEPAVPVEPRWLVATRTYWPVAAGVAALLGIATVVLVWRRSSKQAATKALELRAATAAGALGGAAASPELGAGMTPGELPAAPLVSFEEIRAQALELAAKDPATAAVVLRQWLGSAPAAVAAS
jgi:flagellar M-ring protein FliF